MVLDVCLELNQPPSFPQATPSDFAQGPTLLGVGGGTAERAWPHPQDYELKLFPLLVLLGSTCGSGWEGEDRQGPSLPPPDRDILPLNLFFLSSLLAVTFLVVSSFAQGLSLPHMAILSSPRLFVCAPETEPIPRSREQTEELSFSPVWEGTQMQNPPWHLTLREWQCRVISLTLRAWPVGAGSSFPCFPSFSS